MRVTSVLFLAFLISASCPGIALAQLGSVFFVPDTTYLLPSDSTQIDLAVDSYLNGIHCYIVSIGFDTSLVDLVDVIEGPLLPNVGQTFFFWSQSDGGYDIGSCLLGYGLYADGPGVLATMKFRSRDSTGVSSLHFTNQEFSDTLLNPINVLPLYGAIVVTDSLPVEIHGPETESGIPHRLILYQNFPNPFNSRTSIRYGLSEPCFVKIEIYNVLARLVDVLASSQMPAGYHEVSWNAGGLVSGVYYVRLTTGEFSTTKKMLLIK